MAFEASIAFICGWICAPYVARYMCRFINTKIGLLCRRAESFLVSTTALVVRGTDAIASCALRRWEDFYGSRDRSSMKFETGFMGFALHIPKALVENFI